MRYPWLMTCLAILVCASCGKDKSEGSNCDDCEDVREAPDQSTTPDATSNIDTPDVSTPDAADAGADMAIADMPPTCNRVASGADDARKLVVGLPFTGSMFEVFDLSATGELTRPGVTFDMGAAHEGEIQFTVDGEVGYAVQEDGTIGIFRFNDSGMPEVLVARHDPGFYVSGLLIDAAGAALFSWETGWRKTDDGTHAGAMYRIPIDCNSGMLQDPEEIFRGKLIRSAQWLSPTRLGIAAVDVIDIETPDDVHIVDLQGPTRVASVSAFPDDEAIAAGFGITRDGLYMLVGDNSAFSGVPNRVGVIGIQGDDLFAQQVIDIQDPTRILTSPFNNAALVLSTTGDDIIVLDYNPAAAATAFSVRGPLATTDPTLLPLGATMVGRGSLEGLVLIGENVGVRRVQFEPDGQVTDLGLLALGDGPESITGALGLQP